MKTLQARSYIFFKAVWSGILGIASELVLVAVFILSAFLVCIVWWSIFK